jgi:hypothetical protein
MPDEPESRSSASTAMKAFAVRSKGYATVIVAIAGLVTALGGWLRKPEEKIAKGAYEVFVKEVADLHAEVAKLHDDMIATNAYLRAKEEFYHGLASPAPSAAPLAVAVAVPVPVPAHNGGGGAGGGNPFGVVGAMGAHALPPMPGVAPMIPPVSAKPPVRHLPPVDAL